MGIRETLNQNPSITTGATIGVILLALGFIVYQIVGVGDGVSAVTEMYYTTDDGKTYFADDVNKVSPFDHNGQEAVRAYVFSCDNKSTQFVAYLERMTPEAKKKLEESRAKAADPSAPGGPGGPGGMEMEFLMMEGMEVKKPGDANWSKRNSPEAEKAFQVTCPDGKNENLMIVLPND